MKVKKAHTIGKNLIWVLIVLFTGWYAFFSIVRHIRYETFIFDLGYYDQILWIVSHGKPFFSSIIGAHPWSDHFSPTFLLLTPLYLLHSSPLWLLLIQAVALPLGGYPLYKLALLKTKSAFVSLSLAFSYMSFWGIMSAISFDFHPLALGAPALLFVIWFYETKRWKLFWIATVLFAGLQENYLFFVAFLGIYLFVKYKDARRGISIFILSVLAFLLLIFVAHPLFFGESYSYLSRVHPDIISSPIQKLQVVGYGLGSFSLLPLFSPVSWILLAEEFAGRFISSNGNWWSLGFHYNALFGAIMSLGALDAVVRLKRYQRVLSSLLVVSTLIALFLVKPDTLKIVSPSFYDFTKVGKYGDAVARIPVNASVGAANDIGAHLSERVNIQFLANCIENNAAFGSDSRRCYEDLPQYMIADFSQGTNWNAFYPDYDRESLLRYFTELVKRNLYTIDYSHEGIVILKRII